MLRRRTAGMLAASTVMVVASMGLSGCGPDNPAPKPFNPPKAASSSGSSSSSVDSVPQMPDEAKQNNAAGAKAFVRYYFEVFSEAAKTGDVRELDELAGPDCANCRRSAQSTTKIYRAGGWIRGGEFTPVRFERMTLDAYQFTVTVKINQQTQATASAAATETFQPETARIAVELSRGEGPWRMAEWAFLK